MGYMMLLNEIYAKDIDVGYFDKKVLVNIHQLGEDGLNITTLYPLEQNKENLKRSKDELLGFGFIEELDQKDFYVTTETGVEALKRASLVDESGNINDAQAKEFMYDEINPTATDSIDSVGSIDDVGMGSDLELSDGDDTLF